jgi:hypothetical protein
MKDYRDALGKGEDANETVPSVGIAPEFASIADFYTWFYQDASRAPNGDYYTKTQMEILDLIESDVIDFLYELRVDHNVEINITDFLDSVVLPNINYPKVDDIDDEDESGLFDE